MELFLRMIASIWRPHAGQEEFLCNGAKIRVLACGRRWGKTDACAVSILAELFREKPSRHLIIAPTQDQAKLLFDRVVSLLQEILGESRADEFKVRRTPFPNLSFGNHTVTARSGHIGRSLRGNEATHIVVDEAAYVPEELVTEVAMPMLATNHGRLTLISTPNGLNHFWRFFRMGEEGQNGVWSRTAPSSESPFVSVGFLEVQRQLISQRAYEIEYEAQFVDPAGTVFPIEEIEACLAPSVEINDDPIVIGVDWARYSDFSAVSVLQGFRQDCQLLELRQFNGLNWKDQVAQVAEVAARYPKARIVGDGTGIGDVIMEMLADAVGAHRVQCVTFTNSIKRGLIDGLKSLVESHSVHFEPDPELIRQLKHFESKQSPTGNLILNARTGYHDDMVIALALAASRLDRKYWARVKVGGERRIFARLMHNLKKTIVFSR